MKKLFLLSLVAGGISSLNEAQAQAPEKTRVLLADSTQLLSYPMDVMSIITTKCLGCHQPNARSEKAREELQWIELQGMPVKELAGKLDEILEVLEEGSMPPAKMLERFPAMKLTDEEVALLKGWAESTLTAAIGE